MWQYKKDKKIIWTIDEPMALKNHEGFHYQKEIFERWTDKELKKIGITVLKPGKEGLELLRAKKIKELSEYYHNRISKGFVWNDETFDIDTMALSSINAELMFQFQEFDDTQKIIVWRGYENQNVKMEIDEFVDFAKEARKYSNLLRETKAIHEKAISKKRSIKTIAKYDVRTKWPKNADDFLALKGRLIF